MTAKQNLDRTTRAWLDLMPDELPDRVIADVLLAVESAPQDRRPGLVRPLRSNDMNRLLLVAAAAVLGVVVVGGFLLAGSRQTIPPPSQAALVTPPAPSATPAVSAPPLPAALQGSWFGPHRDLPGIEAGSGTMLHVDPRAVWNSPPNEQAWAVLKTDATGDADQLHVVTSSGTTIDSHCQPADAGTYRWSLSPAADVLTITAVDDACPERATAFAGTWWRAGCKIGTTCIGDLEAGSYASQYFNLRANESSTWHPMFGSVTYTVPSGWANAADWPSELALTPSSTYAQADAAGNPPDGVTQEIRVFARPAAALQDGNCGTAADPNVTTAADGLGAWLTSLPGLTVGHNGLGDVDGHRAVWADIRLADPYSKRCPGESKPSMALLAPRGTTADGPYTVGLVAGERMRIILVQVIGGDVAAIVIDDRNDATAPDATSFQAFVDAAMPIIDSMKFQ